MYKIHSTTFRTFHSSLFNSKRSKTISLRLNQQIDSKTHFTLPRTIKSNVSSTIAAPSATSPSATSPSTSTPSTSTPSTSTPSTATPSTSTPSTATPSTATPSTATPSTTSPSITASTLVVPSSISPSPSILPKPTPPTSSISSPTSPSPTSPTSPPSISPSLTLNTDYTSSFKDLDSKILKDIVKRLKVSLLSQSHKSIILSNPHPGAIQFTQDLLLKATKELENTSLISLDYKDILDFQSDLPRDTIKTIVDRNTIYTTPSFSPSMFKSRNDIISVGSYGMSHSATFQEKSVQRDEHHQHHQQQQHQQQQQEDDQDQDHVDLEDLEEDIPAYFIGKMYQSQLHSDWTKVIANKTVHANQQSPNTSSRIELNQSEVQRLSPNHYSEHLSPTQTQSIQDQLYLQIMKQSEKSRIIVLFLKDMTEIINTARSGKEVVVAIMSAVSKARKRGHSPIIVYNFTPSLMDSENTTKDLGIYQDMLMKEFEFGDNDGTIYRLDLWNSKQINLFASPFDAMTGSMVKINIPPVVNHIPGSLDCLERELIAYDWLVCMNLDMKQRIKEINWKNLMSIVYTRHWLVPGSTRAYLTVDNKAIDHQISHLGHQVLDQHALEDIADLALGCKLECDALNANEKRKILHKRRALTDPTIIDIAHFAEALRLIFLIQPYSSQIDRTLQKEQVDAKEMESKMDTLKEESTIKSTFQNPPETVDQDEIDPKMDSKAESSIKMTHLLKKLTTHEKKLMSTVVDPELIKVQFSDLILPANTKVALQSIVTLPLLYPIQYSTGILANHSINGVLLFGPPGTGKTMLAKALAKAGGAKFMKVALSDIFDKYVGEGEKNIKAIFTLARKLSPCVVFLDEVDAVFGARRGNDQNGSRREVINEFMSEWDGLTSNNDGILILGATNRPFDLDDAILRRMPRRILVDLPTEPQRLSILESHLKGEQLDNVDLKMIAKQTTSYSGSDLKNVCVSAAVTCVKNMVSVLNVCRDSSMNSSECDKTTRILTQAHFDTALIEIPPSLTDEMQTLIELRKWNDAYGENANATKSKKKGWGFEREPLIS